MDLPESKICTKCRKLLPRSAFSTQKDGKYLYPSCKKCKTIARIGYQRKRIAPDPDGRIFRCRACGLQAGIDKFYRSRRRGSSEFCKECFREHRKKVRKSTKSRESQRKSREKRSELVRLAKDSPCVDCGKTFPACTMDFDHVRGEKRFNLSTAHNSGRSLVQVRREIEKCDLICANCHRTRTQLGIVRNDSVVSHRTKMRDLIISFKDKKTCADCNQSFPYWVMDFDHLLKKTMNISKMCRWSEQKILEEIEKCELVCAVCHRIRTWQRKNGSLMA